MMTSPEAESTIATQGSPERDSGRSSSRERSNGRDRPNDREYSKKKKFSNSSNKWMSSNGEDLSDGDDSGESNMLWWEEEVEGVRVGLALQAAKLLWRLNWCVLTPVAID